MLFQTTEFLVLFIVSVLGIAALRTARHQHVMMAILSYTFYAWWDVRFVSLVLVTTLVDYVAALGMDGVRISWGKRARLSGLVILGSVATLAVNWPMIQHGTEPFSWAEVLNPKWRGVWLSIGGCAAFAIIAPIFYERYFSLEGRSRRRAFLWTSVIANLTVLGFFKYFDFFADSLVGIGHALGYDVRPPHLEVLLPVGISFYTFVSMSYTIDVYRGRFPAEASFLRFALFVCYYPHLVAGPIIRPENFLPTLKQAWTLRGANVISGAHLIMNGMFKKVLIADNIASRVDVIFADPTGLPSIAVWLGTVLFAVQIYCDFSGYSDIARGVSRVFGVELPLNFNYPYLSTSIIDFWRTWHISLSTWLRDYLYIPLGGGRVRVGRLYFNLMATMVLGGLWHGASWNFVLWGAYQGGLLCINRLLRAALEHFPRADALMKTRAMTVVRWALTMYFVLLGWLIFRVTNFDHLWYCLRKFAIFDGSLRLETLGLARTMPFVAILAAMLFAALHAWSFFRGRIHDRLDRTRPVYLPFIYATLAVIFFFGWPTENAAFIYFQF